MGKMVGIQIKIGAETSSLQNALKGVNKSIKTTNQELKSVQSLLKMNPGNTDLVRQKQQLLAKQVSDTTDKLKQMKTAQSQALAEGKVDTEGYRDLQRQIIKTENELKGLRVQAVESGAIGSTSMETLSASLKKVSQRANAAGDKMKSMGHSLRIVSGAALAVVAGMGSVAYSAGKVADDINTLSKQTGISTGELQQFKYASDLLDVSLETMAGSHSKLTKNMYAASQGSKMQADAFAALGIAVSDSNGELRDGGEVFNEAIRALGDMENETQRDALAMQLFGRSAQELNPLIENIERLDELNAEFDALGLGLSQEELDKANEFNDAIDTLKATIGQAALFVGAHIGPALMPKIESLRDGIASVARWIAGLSPTTIRLIAGLAAVVGAAAPLLLITGHLAGALGNITGLLSRKTAQMAASTAATATNTATTTANAAAQTTAGKATGKFSGALKMLKFAALGGAILGVILLIKMFAEDSEAVSDKIASFTGSIVAGVSNFATALPGIVAMVSEVLPQVLSTLTGAIITTLPVLISAGVSIILALVDGLVTAIPQIVAILPVILQTIITAITTNLPIIINVGITLILALIQGLVQAIPIIVETLPTIILAIVNAIVESLPMIIETGITLILALIQGLVEAIPVLLESLPTIINAIVTGVTENLPMIINAGITLIIALIQGLVEAIPIIIENLPIIIEAIGQGFVALIGAIISVGWQLLQGLWTGISSYVSTLHTNNVNMARSIPGKIKEGLGSLVSIGADWLRGLWTGISSVKDWIIEKIQGIGGDILDGIKDFFDIHSPSRVMRFEVGKPIGEGLGLGIEDQTANLIQTVRTQGQAVLGAYTSTGFGGNLSGFNYSANRAMAPMGAANLASAGSGNDALAQAMLTGMQQLMSVMLQAFPNEINVNVDGKNIASASWDELEKEGRRKGKIFAPSPNELALAGKGGL